MHTARLTVSVLKAIRIIFISTIERLDTCINSIYQLRVVTLREQIFSFIYSPCQRVVYSQCL